MKEELLQNWVFHFNPYTELWAAIPREHYLEYWSNPKAPNVIRSKTFKTLIEIILKTNGDEKLIEKLISK